MYTEIVVFFLFDHGKQHPMADALVASSIVNSLINKNKERFEEDDGGDLFYTESPSAYPSKSPFFPTVATPTKATSKFDWFSFILSALISAVAIFLSWSCNSALGYGTLEKVVYAAGAGLFGTLFLCYHVLFRGDICKAASK